MSSRPGLPELRTSGHARPGILARLAAAPRTASAQRFRNGRVDFAVARGAEWDERGPRVGTGNARFWILADGLEVWMNLPECEIFATAEEAHRNQHK